MTQPAIIRVRARLIMPTSKPSKWKICHDRGTITEYRQAMVITSIRCCLAIGPQNSSGEPAIFFRGANVNSEDCQNRCDITKRNVSAPGVPCADEHRRIPNDRESRCKVRLLSKPRAGTSATIPSIMFAVSRSCAPSAARSQKTLLYSTEVRPSARPAAIHAHIPAIEIAFGDTLREASHAVAACAHLRFRVAMADDELFRR